MKISLWQVKILAMKKIRKHNFKYRDPENVVLKKETTAIKNNAEEKEVSVIKSDLKRTVITVAGFVVIITVFYFIQTKTELLNPVLKFFKI